MRKIRALFNKIELAFIHMHANTMSYTDIAAELDRPKSSVANYIRRNNLRVDPDGTAMMHVKAGKRNLAGWPRPTDHIDTVMRGRAYNNPMTW